jgi:hypothetical protein
MKKIFVLSLFFGGYSSNPTPEDSQLSWNKRASWENRLDISTFRQFHKEYKPENFDRNRKKSELKINFKESESQLKAIQGEDYNESMRSNVIDQKPGFSSKHREIITQEITKNYPEEFTP